MRFQSIQIFLINLIQKFDIKQLKFKIETPLEKFYKGQKCSQELQSTKQIEEIINLHKKMLRKNSFANLQKSAQSSPHKYMPRALNYSRQSQISNLNKQCSYQGLSYEDLVQKIHKQEQQIQKLSKIIDLYKCKVAQFAQYQPVIQALMETKGQQKIKSQMGEKKYQIIKSKIVVKPQQSNNSQDKNLHTQIVHVLDYIIESKSDHHHSDREEKSQISSKINSLNTSSQSFSQKMTYKQQQIKLQPNIQKEKLKVIDHFSPKYTQRQFIQNPPLYQEKENMNGSQFLLANLEKQKDLHRIPSLQNMRRMQKCFKMLNS